MRTLIILVSLLLGALGNGAGAKRTRSSTMRARWSAARCAPRRTRSRCRSRRIWSRRSATVQETGPNGARIDQGKPQISGDMMRVAIKAAGPRDISR